MKRLLTAICLAMLCAMFTVTSFAQDVLPLPDTPMGENAPRATLDTIKPAMFVGLRPGDTLEWSNMNMSGTVITFKILQTGQVIKWQPSVLCAATCKSINSPTALFEAAKNGQDVDWFVTVGSGSNKIKSNKSRLIVTEVTSGALITPTHLAEVSPASLTSLVWADWGLVVKYTLVIKDLKNGKVVLKQKLLPADVCADFAPYPYDKCTYTFGGANPTASSILKPNRYYKWFVKSVGPTGEKTVSNKFTLSTHKQ